VTSVLVFKFGGRPSHSTLWFLIPQYFIFCHIGDSVIFKFGGMDGHIICLFVFIYLKINNNNCYVVVKHELVVAVV
jgi:hypothetical protein